jgi:O-antigen/teichoic acid export membrane protein
MVFLAASAEHRVPFRYGNQWQASIGPGQVLALTAVFVVDALDHALYAGIGRPVLWTLYTLYSSVLLVAATWIGSGWGLLAVVWAGLAANLVVTVIRWFVAARQLRTSGWTLVGAFVRVAAPGVLAAGAGYLVTWLTSGLPPLVGVVLVGLAVLAVFLPVFRLTARDTWDELEGIARRGLRRIVRRGPATSS